MGPPGPDFCKDSSAAALYDHLHNGKNLFKIEGRIGRKRYEFAPAPELGSRRPRMWVTVRVGAKTVRTRTPNQEIRVREGVAAERVSSPCVFIF
jgi:hypothetical protein